MELGLPAMRFLARKARNAVGVSVFVVAIAWAAVNGSIAGLVKDPTGLVVPGATVTVTNAAQGFKMKGTTDSKGAYAFPSLPVGRYDLRVEATGFKPQLRSGIAIDLDSAIHLDLTLEIAEQLESITVDDTAMRVETASSQVGEVVKGKSMTAVALNGRSFTDLLSLQAGIVPVSTQLPD